MKDEDVKNIADLIVTDAMHRRARVQIENTSSHELYILIKMDDEGTIFVNINDDVGNRLDKPPYKKC